MTKAPSFSVVADVAIVKGETPDGDRTWLSFPDGTARRAPVQVIQDLPHLVVESVFGLGDGRWGTLAAAESASASGPEPEPAPPPVISRGNGRIRLVTSTPSGRLAPGGAPPGGPAVTRLVHPVATAAVNAVLNRWRAGPDTPDGVRDRLRSAGRRPAELAGELTDEQIRLADAGVRRLYRDWAALPVGGTLRATWPLHDSWLRLL